MKKFNSGRNFAALLLAWTMIVMPLAAIGQTRIVAPKNKYKVQDDVKLGQQAAQQVEQQMPILRDAEATRYVQQVGERLVAAIPPQFQHPEFRYSFQIVNASDINAFALPGGPMFVNRGMIEAAKNEGEMAGVMAHELSHVALRHGTAQATEVNKPLNQILGIGAILGGAILGGQTGAQLGQIFAQGYFTKFSRQYETQADTLGAQIMARAGYDPHDLANMFKTIEAQGGSRTPEFLSDHPNPENRFENINREADMLRVRNPIRNTAQFERIQSKLGGMPRAQTMAQIEQNANRNEQGGGQNTMSNGKYENRVEYPSSRVRSYNGGFVTFNVPDNWQMVSQSQTEVWFSPQGAFGSDGITRGALVGIANSNGRTLQQKTDEYVNGLLQQQGNNYLRANGNYSRTSIGGRSGLAIVLSGRSPITNQTEVTTVSTTQLRNGELFYIITVTPQGESASYNRAFSNLIRSIRLND
ncbi:MAG: M48 family metalloprotease [Pyrinomonadaceae bacterium]